MSQNVTTSTQDEYLNLRQAGFSDGEIREYMQPRLREAGFSDQEITGYFKGYDPVSLLDALHYGFQGSITGLWQREKLPDTLTPEQVSGMSLSRRIAAQVGTLAGDAPTLLIGGALGTLGGPAAPATVPGGAMALTEGTRAIYMEQIKNGDVRSAEEFTNRMGIVLKAAAKGGAIGAATGTAGKLAGMAAESAGAGILGKGAATVAAEVATMPTVAAGMEGRLPEPQEFVDAAILVAGLKATGAAGTTAVRVGADLVPKLRGIYAKTGKPPLEVMEDARVDPGVRQDLLSTNREIPQQYTERKAPAPESEARASAVKGEGEQRERAASGGTTTIPEAERAPLVGEAALSETYKLSGVIDRLAADLGVTFRVGRLGPYVREVVGIYKESPEVARTRVANDITTIVHEAGHHVQKKAFGSLEDTPLRPYRDELSSIASTPLEGQSALPEGFAEFVARYVVNPQQAREEAPRFYPFFEEHMSRNAPDMLRALQEAREGVRRWNTQPEIMEVLSQINIGQKPEGIIRKTWRDAYTTFIDDLHPLKKVVRKLTADKDIPAHMDPYLLARTFRGAAGKATHFLERSPFLFKTGANVGKPLKAILTPIKNLDELRAYLIAKRGLELENRGIRSGMRRNAMQKTVDSLREKYEGTARELYEYQDHLLRYYADAGMLNPKALKALREANKSYVPFYRFMGDVADETTSGGGRGFSPRNEIRRIKGSGREILDPLESILKNTYALIEAAEKNQVGRALADLAEASGDGYGGLVEKIPPQRAGTRVSGKTIMQALEGVDEQAAKAFSEAVERGELDIGVFRDNFRIDKKTEISVVRNGEREIYQVDPELAKVINGLDGESLGVVTRILSAPAKLLRAGATLTPDFILRNIARDALSSFVQSEYGYRPWVDLPRGLMHALRRDDLYWRWKRSGGDQATLLGMDRTTVRRTLDDLTRSGVLPKTWNLIKNPFELFRILSELSEQASRLGEFSRAEKILGNDKNALTKAALASRDVSVDFARIGARMRAANALIAFTNARVQGLDKMVRTFKEHPGRSTLRAVAAITLPSVLLEIANYGDERIKEVPRWQRDLFWCIPVGDTVYRIPKPFELGTIFGSIPERITEWALDQMNDQERSDAFRGLGTTLFDVVKPPVLPTAFVPVVETWANKSFAFDRPIIPASREGMLPEYQYTENTTELAKALSHFVGTLPTMNEMRTFSPAMAENLIRNYTGGSGLYVAQGLDYLLRKTGVLPDPVRPAATLADIPFVRAFVVRHPSMSAESIAKFQERWKEASSYLRTINGLQKEYKYDDVANLMPYHVYTALKGAHDTLSTLSQTIYEIKNAPGMTADEKRQYIDTLYFQCITVARYGNDIYDQVKQMIDNLKKSAGK